MARGPGVHELRIRLGISLVGLCAVVIAALARGMAGAATVEVLTIAGLFFGGTAAWTARALIQRSGDK